MANGAGGVVSFMLDRGMDGQRVRQQKLDLNFRFFVDAFDDRINIVVLAEFDRHDANSTLRVLAGI